MHKIKQQHQQQEEDLKHNDSIVSLSSLKYRDYSIRSRSWIDAAHELKPTKIQIFWEGHKNLKESYPGFLLTLNFGFSEKATKFEKILIVFLTRVSCSVRATCQKVDEDFSK